MISSLSTSQMLGSIAGRRSITFNLNTPRSTILLVLVVATLCYVAPKTEGALMLNFQTAWPLWPDSAILVAAMMLVPTRIWAILIPASFAGIVLYDLQAGVPVTSIAWFIPADTIQVLIAATGLRYCFKDVPRLNNINSLAKYCFFAVLLAPLAAAFVSAPGISGNYWASWRISFLSEVLAFLTLTPAMLSWFSEGPACLQKPRAYHLECVVLIAATVVLGYLIFGTSTLGQSPAVLYALVPFLLWSSLRFGSIGITTSMMVIGFLSIWGVVHGQGPFNAPGTHSGILSLQLFLIFASIPFLVLTALVEDRKIAGERLANLSRGLIEAQEKERSRIARELHDDIGQRFALLGLALEELKEKSIRYGPEDQMGIDNIRKDVSDMASDIQSLSHELHSSKLEYLGLVAAIKIFCKEFAERQNVQIDFRSHDVPGMLRYEVSLCLFRVLQESLQNSAKHSGARNLEARLWASSGQIHLTVQDSGRGFDLAAASGGAGLGLISMRERLKSVGGTLSIESQHGSGTTIHARIPLESGA
jgi:signal transduction histidine kinase